MLQIFGIDLLEYLKPIAIGLLFIGSAYLFREPKRKIVMALLLAGAGAAYLNGGFGPWEFIFNLAILVCAYKGLQSYRWIGAGWLLHAGWDILHHLYGNPILSFEAMSSFGCAICDPLITLWCYTIAAQRDNAPLFIVVKQ